MSSKPFLRLMKLSVRPALSGPGRYNAPIAITSSNSVGLSSRRYRFMPLDSNWNTPVVSPRPSSAKVFSSSRGISLRLISVLYTRLIIRSASLMMVKLLRPKKSILSKPSSSICPIGNCAATTPFCAISSGTYSTRLSGAITTPQACTPWLRTVPSSAIAISITDLLVSLVSYSFLRSGSFTMLVASGM